ncbi:MAG: pyruvate kinase [Nanoarchaeota archaeon]|nr:pyruvate kinase [Nanoarchaeota archaeon]
MRDEHIKIISTVGPASDDPRILSKMVDLGVDIFRLNLSHNSLDYHINLIKIIKSLKTKSGKKPVILADLPGPKFRIGELKSPLSIRRNLIYSLGPQGDIPLDYEISKELSLEHPIRLSDGKLLLRPIRKQGNKVLVKAMDDFILLGNQSIIQKGLEYHGKYPTDRDRKLVSSLLDVGIDIFGLSFVSSETDVRNMRKLVGDALLVAKIERKSAVDNFSSIIRSADAVMVARGDLGLNLDISEVPILQRRMIYEAHEINKPVIVATQILESMTDQPSPTRAEADDIFAAVTEGADALMLSEETAIGKYPLLAVRALRNLGDRFSEVEVERNFTIKDENDAVVASAVELLKKTGIKHVIVITEAGISAFRLSRYDLNVKIIAITNSLSTVEKLTFGRNIVPYYFKDLREGLDRIKGELSRAGISKAVLVSGEFGIKDSTTKVEVIYT